MTTHHMVAHKWAHQSGRGNRARGFNMYYEGDTIYSYGAHFPIARIVDAGTDRACVLFTTRSYSVSTAKHISITRGACRHMPIFHVPNVTGDAPHFHAANADQMALSFRCKLDSALKRRKASYADMDIQDAERLASEHAAYCERFGVAFTPLTMPASMDEWRAGQAERLEAEHAREAEQDEARRIEAERRNAELLKAREEKLAEWKAGADVSLPYVHGAAHHMRIKGDEVQTTGGARFPLCHGKRAVGVLRELRSRLTIIGETVRPDALIRLGDFRIDYVNADGVRAGCHFVPWSEVERLADELGI